jgi:hypothetical protein
MWWTLPKTAKKNPTPHVRQFYRDELAAMGEFQVTIRQCDHLLLYFTL